MVCCNYSVCVVWSITSAWLSRPGRYYLGSTSPALPAQISKVRQCLDQSMSDQILLLATLESRMRLLIFGVIRFSHRSLREYLKTIQGHCIKLFLTNFLQKNHLDCDVVVFKTVSSLKNNAYNLFLVIPFFIQTLW